MNQLRFLPLLFALLVAASPLRALPLTVINAGFEDISGESSSNGLTFGSFSGWSLYEEAGLDTSDGNGPDFFVGTLTPSLNPDTPDPDDFYNYPGGAAEGDRVALAFSFAGRPGSGGGLAYGLTQALGDTLQANTQYTLQIDVGNIASGTSFDLRGFPGYRIDLLAGTTILASDDNTLAGSIAEGAFALSTVTYISGASSAHLGEVLSIRMVSLNVTDPNPDFADAELEVNFDNVRLDAVAVPEPAAAALISLGLVSLLVLRRRRDWQVGG